MSFDLNLLVHDAVDTRELMDFTRTVMGIAADVPVERNPFERLIPGYNAYSPGTAHLHSVTGNGPASVNIYYGIDGPMQGSEYEHGEGWQDRREHNGWSSAAIHLGTSFAGSDVLFYIVDQVGRWLDRRGIIWCWEDPQQGQEYDSLPEYSLVESGYEVLVAEGWLS